jgi:CRISPR-associated protein Cmr1
MFPKQEKKGLENAVSLADAFGTIGGRCRNGFGSLSLSGSDGGFAELPVAAPVQDFFSEQHPRRYPHGLARDQKGVLCWEYRQAQTWKDVMQIFAELYRDVRTSFPFTSGHALEKRHILGYPAGTGHKVTSWGGNNGRMPSQLRLMVKRDKTGSMVGRILHLPHLLPKPWDAAQLGSELDVWKQVHGFLDKRPELKRCGGAR